VKQTGGWITVRSEWGNGTTVDIYFPQMQTEKSAEERVSKIKASPAANAGGSETILVVEDQNEIRDLVSEFLQKNGYTVLQAADGNEALQIAHNYKHPIHLLLTDVVMPNIGGQELARRLTQPRPQMPGTPQVSKIKVLFMSGYPDHATWGTELVDDTATVLQKPFPLQTLATKIRILLDE
jgi:two-component system cell cycle sensor histidine kinase/response regulator CckA